jgi:hypothetical protein
VRSPQFPAPNVGQALSPANCLSPDSLTLAAPGTSAATEPRASTNGTCALALTASGPNRGRRE